VLRLHRALAIQRVSVALFFMAHALVRIFNGTIPRFAEFMRERGWPAATELVILITLVEVVCGVLLILDRHARLAAAPLAAIALGGIVIIHWNNGWFVGEHGTGGMEYSVALLVALWVVAAADTERRQHPMAVRHPETARRDRT
jgi:putative oxidoreductase